MVACSGSSSSPAGDAPGGRAGESSGGGSGGSGGGSENGGAPPDCPNDDCSTPGGAGGEAPVGGAAGQGGAGPGESCSVVVLVQNSGKMFEVPSQYDSYYYWLREALSTSGSATDMLLDRAEVELSFFMRAEALECPDLREYSVDTLAEVEAAFDSTVNETGGVNKSDAPVAEAVAGAIEALAGTAVQAAAAVGVTTHVLGLGDDTMLDALTNAGGDGFETYLKQLANAGAQQPVAKQAMFDYVYGSQCPALGAEYHDDFGSAQAFQAVDQEQLEAALDELLDGLWP